MKRIRIAGLLAALAFSSGAQSGGEAATPVVLRGEVVDLHCYITRGAKGPDHASCGSACISRGVSAGFLAEDGALYVLLAEKPFSAKDAVASLVGAPVTARGRMLERGGVKALQLASIERRSASF